MVMGGSAAKLGLPSGAQAPTSALNAGRSAARALAMRLALTSASSTPCRWKTFGFRASRSAMAAACLGAVSAKLAVPRRCDLMDSLKSSAASLVFLYGGSAPSASTGLPSASQVPNFVVYSGRAYLSRPCASSWVAVASTSLAPPPKALPTMAIG